MTVKTTYKEYLGYLRRAYPHWTEAARRKRAWRLHERQTLIPKEYDVRRPSGNAGGTHTRWKDRVGRRKPAYTSEKFVCDRCRRATVGGYEYPAVGIRLCVGCKVRVSGSPRAHIIYTPMGGKAR